MTEEQKSLGWLSSILDILLKECPWDSAQTIDSLRYLTIEEVFELAEAITANDYDDMRKELGDLFMHLLFYSKLAEKEQRFSASDVIDSVCRKLINRHPHIALPDRDGNMQPARQASTPHWEEVKMTEGRKSTLEGVPSSLPTLVKAIRLQEKAAGSGFEFPDSEGAHAKVYEEYNEFMEALANYKQSGDPADKKAAEAELGDLLFAVVKWGRLEGINADNALALTNLKFQRRFSYVEQQAHLGGRSISELSLQEMVTLWNEAKKL